MTSVLVSAPKLCASAAFSFVIGILANVLMPALLNSESTSVDSKMVASGAAPLLASLNSAVAFVPSPAVLAVSSEQKYTAKPVLFARASRLASSIEYDQPTTLGPFHSLPVARWRAVSVSLGDGMLLLDAGSCAPAGTYCGGSGLNGAGGGAGGWGGVTVSGAESGGGGAGGG